MPYFVHPKDVEAPQSAYREDFPSFTTRADAFAFMRDSLPDGQKTHAIAFVASYDELSQWKAREMDRFHTGHYIQVPWKDCEPYTYRLHFAHLSVDKPGMVAYTADAEAGIADKQTRVTPGRYFERFYGPSSAFSDTFTREQIAQFVAMVTGSFAAVSIARSVADIRKVYRNGPSSCMGGSPAHTNQYWQEADLDGHMPVEVYAEPSDLAVAYFGPIDKPSQRCIVWPTKKTYYRIYGTGPLETLLQKDGYYRGDYPECARIRRIDLSNGGVLIPYVDGVDRASYGKGEERQFLILDERGEIDCSKTTGCYGADEDSEDYTRCIRCGDETPVDDTDDGLCSTCHAERWTCDRCDRDYYSNERATTVGDDVLCESCTANITETCQDEDCSNTWINEREFSPTEIEARERHDVADLCPTCAARYVWCDHCEVSHDNPDGICDCGRAPRCEKTADLLTMADDICMFRDIPIGARIQTLTTGYYGRKINSHSILFDALPGQSTDCTSNTCPDVFPERFYRVIDEPPSMPFPHGLTIDEIVASEAASV